MVCYLVLMENNGGILDKSPDYLVEKEIMLQSGYEAFGYLDIHNMRKVDEWCKAWNVEMPESCALYLGQSEEAFTELQGRGFNF